MIEDMVTLPNMVVVVLSFVIPKFVTIMTANIQSRVGTFAVSIVFSAVVGAGAAYISGVGLADLWKFAAVTASMANLVYQAVRAYQKPNEQPPVTE